jgi:hypothetical protein
LKKAEEEKTSKCAKKSKVSEQIERIKETWEDDLAIHEEFKV